MLKLAATCHQRLLGKRATQARMMTSAQTIFLWLCHRHLHVRLARQTSWQQQRDAALTHLHYEQECCAQTALTEEQQRQAAGARAKSLAEPAAHAAALREENSLRQEMLP